MFCKASCEPESRLGWLLLVVGCFGCGDGRPVAHPTSGTVAVDGRPLEGVELIFYPQAAPPSDVRVPNPRAVTDAEGHFEVSTYEGRDGAPAGEYRVGALMVTPIPKGADPESFQQTDRFGSRYVDPETSGLSVVVSPGRNELPPIELVTAGENR